MRGLDGYPVGFGSAGSSSADLHHSPSRATNPEVQRVYRDLVLRERLREDVHGHIFCWTIDEFDVFVGNRLADKMKSNIDVFSARMVIIIGSETERGLVVAIKRGRDGHGAE